MDAMNQSRRGDLEIVRFEKMVQSGQTLGRLADGRVIFVRGGAPDEVAEVKLTKIKPGYAEGELVEVQGPSPGRVELPFPIEDVAGATWAHLDYPTQLRSKEQIVRDQLAGFPDLLIHPITPCEELWRYRNKIEPSFGRDEMGETGLGFYLPGRFDRIRLAHDVALFPDWIKDVLRRVNDWARREDLSIWDPRRHEGLVRNLVVRRGVATSDRLVNLVTNQGEVPLGSLADALHGLRLTSLVHTVNTNLSGAFSIDEYTVVDGRENIAEIFLNLPLEYRFDSFFQTNVPMAERVARELIQHLPEIRPSVFIDAYGGVGTFGLVVANELKLPVIQIEAHTQSYHDAKSNILRLDLSSVMHAVRSEMEEFVRRQPLPRDGFLFLDPPRAGLHPRVIRTIVKAGLEHLGYLSCNIATLARDLQGLVAEYEITEVYAYDFFPQTHHIETLVFLKKKN